METKRLKGYLATLMIIAFIGLVYLLLDKKVPEQNNDLLMVLLGAMVGTVKDLYGYYFGSSEGSQRKTELMGAANATTTAGGTSSE
jgi:uncharacterized membrane protein